MRYILGFIFILCSEICISQSDFCCIKVLDSSTNDIIPYSHLINKVHQIGTISNTDGTACFPHIDSNSVIEISAIGYYTETVSYNDLNLKNQIYLRKKIIELSTFSIGASALIEKALIEAAIENFSKGHTTEDMRFLCNFSEMVVLDDTNSSTLNGLLSLTSYSAQYKGKSRILNYDEEFSILSLNSEKTTNEPLAMNGVSYLLSTSKVLKLISKWKKTDWEISEKLDDNNILMFGYDNQYATHKVVVNTSDTSFVEIVQFISDGDPNNGIGSSYKRIVFDNELNNRYPVFYEMNMERALRNQDAGKIIHNVQLSILGLISKNTLDNVIKMDSKSSLWIQTPPKDSLDTKKMFR